SIEKLEELIVPDDPGADDEDEADTGEASSSAERAAEEDTDSGAGDAQEEDTADEGDKAEGVGGTRAFLQELKSDPGPLQLDTLLAEIVKLERVKAIGLPEGLFEGTVRYSSVWKVSRGVSVSSAAAQRNTLGSPRPESVSH
ncbi:hypothetical protein, partial [Nonomuraea deserti]|uniref:hypothetical protein n=1 Tax=Nonomuraea deserti TaxID=1848322 RepID=UPI001404A00C